MNALVVYQSEFGNTERIARAIGAQLEKMVRVRLASIADASAADLGDLDLLMIGGPTQAHGAPQEPRAWLDGFPEETLRALSVATFDTRLHWPRFLSGSAARTLARASNSGVPASWRRPKASLSRGGRGLFSTASSIAPPTGRSVSASSSVLRQHRPVSAQPILRIDRLRRGNECRETQRGGPTRGRATNRAGRAG